MTRADGGLWTPGGVRPIPTEKDAKAAAKAAATMFLQPIHENILVRRVPDDELSKGGVVIPETARNKMILRGIVVAHGPGRRDATGVLIPIAVAVGDLVLASTYSTCTDVEVGGEKLVLVREQDVLGIFKPLPKTAGAAPEEAPASAVPAP